MKHLDDVAAWRRMLDPDLAAVIAELAAADRIDARLLERLRRTVGEREVAVAAELAAARRKAAAKFEGASRLLCDVEGVEQATDEAVAAHKAARFAAAPALADLCCGIGGDAMALVRACPDAVAVDRSPVRAFMAEHNAGVRVQVADVAGFAAGGRWLHVDPGRRGGGRRHYRYADYEPGPPVVEALLAAAPAAAVKLGPGVDWEAISARGARELEFVTAAQGLVQVVLWTGALARAPGEHTATRLAGGLRFTARPDPVLPVAESAGRWLLVPDPALERARLVAPRLLGTDAGELAPGLGVLTCDARLGDPWFEEHEVLAELPWREQRIRDWLRAHDGGPVIVRTRDKAVDTDALQQRLRGDGAVAHTLFGLRLGRRVVCFVVR